jgi:phenylalanyl-tRNA synthetase alpha chain
VSASEDIQIASPSHDELQALALAELEACSTDESLEQWRIGYLGRSGKLTQVLRSVGSLPVEERKAAGAAANQIKTLLERSFEDRQEELLAQRRTGLAETERIDVTLPGRPVSVGRFHPSTQIVREICDAFASMGFQILEGPEVEWDRYNFELLNIPQDHPARDMWDTLWIDHVDDEGRRPMLLRTHTSPMQARVMESQEPPVRVIVPGKCYRYD